MIHLKRSKGFNYRGEDISCDHEFVIEQRFFQGPSIPNPATAAQQGAITSAELYPYQYLVEALASTGQQGNVTNPITGQTQNLNFTGLGTADVNNATNAQNAATQLALQEQYGPEEIQQALANWQQSDPSGFSDYQQLYNTINNQTTQAVPDIGLATGTQNDILNLVNKGATLNPQSQMQVEQSALAPEVASGIYLGNAPVQNEANAVVGAGDQQRSAAEQSATNFLASGESPASLTTANIQQELANLGAFINGQTPENQFAAVTGAKNGAAPQNQTGYSVPTINEGQAASEGVSNAQSLYDIESANTINPFTAGLSGAAGLAGAAFNLGYSPYNYNFGGSAVPYAQGPYESGAGVYTAEPGEVTSSPWIGGGAP